MYILNELIGAVDGPLVINSDNYNITEELTNNPYVENGLVKLIKYPELSYNANPHCVFCVVSEFIPLLQLLLNEFVFTIMGLGTNNCIDPSIGISF